MRVVAAGFCCSQRPPSASQSLSCRRAERPSGPRAAVFIVSAEGGGIRAAYWTAGLLCAIQDAEPGFADHVLGISGVSGGSLGAATFAGLVAETRRTGLDVPRNADGMGPLQHVAGEVLGRDFLSPVLATMLIPDVAACLLHGEWAKDRAAVS